MIKAKKGLIIALFAAMMVFAFGAISTFAETADVGYDDPIVSDGLWDWEADFTSATFDDEQAVVKWTFGTTDGLTTATATYKRIEGSTQKTYTSVRKFYDFTGSKLDVASPMNLTYYKSLNEEGAVVVMAKPEKATVVPGGSSEITVEFNKAGTNGYKVLYETDQYALAGESADVAASWSRNSDQATKYDGKKFPGAFGTIQKSTVTISSAPGYDTNHWYKVVDGEAKAVEPSNILYDGNEYQLFAPYQKKATITYQKWDGTKWVAEEAINYQHVADAVKYRAVITKSDAAGNVTVTYDEISLKVKQNENNAKVTWTEANAKSQGGHKYYEVTEAQAADPTAFLEFDNGFVKKATKPGQIVGNPDADLDALKAFFNAAYEVKVEKNAVDPKQLTWTVKAKDLTDAEKREIAKTYETLIADYGLDKEGSTFVTSVFGVEKRAVIVDAPTPVLQDDNVDITYAPTKVTYKAKKLKKAAKSFTVEASAKSGKAVTYTLKTSSKKITIDSATGKVTVAKGLKKGTYKITVIARTDDGNGYKAAQDTAAITIKVKK